MFPHILVPTDFTEKNLRAAEIAVELASRDGGRITFLHVIETMEDTAGEEFEAFYEKLRQRAEKSMEDLVVRWEQTGSAPEARILFGKRAPEIVRFAMDNDVALIVLSSHPIDVQDSGRGWGTISYKVAIMAPCPVMMVK